MNSSAVMPLNMYITQKYYTKNSLLPLCICLINQYLISLKKQESGNDTSIYIWFKNVYEPVFSKPGQRLLFSLLVVSLRT